MTLHVRSGQRLNRLAAWPSYVTEWSEEMEAIFSFVGDQLVPYLSERGRRLAVLPAFADFPDGERVLEEPA